LGVEAAVQHRLVLSIISMTWLACAGPTQVRETVARPRIASPSPVRTAKRAATMSKAAPEAARDAKDVASSEPAEDPRDFSGVDVSAPVDEHAPAPQREVAVEGIEGTMSDYDVRSVLEARDQDFDRCHDRFRGGSGRLRFDIHIQANGDVGQVKVHRSKVRSDGLVDCYTEVVASSRFSAPHGGYADVKWTTKVGRSRKRPDDVFERRGRWDALAGAPQAEPRRHHHRPHHHHHHRHHRSRD
jgi:hypothetical protein